MSTIHIGSESEYVKIKLNPPFPSEGCCEANVEIAVPCFHGRIEAWLEKFDIENFASQLTTVYESLQGEARLIPLEEQFTLIVQARTGGHIHISGAAWSNATYENKLEFSLEFDQSFLPKVLVQLQDAINKES